MLGRRRRVAGQAINHCSISADRLAWPDVVARNYRPFPVYCRRHAKNRNGDRRG